MHCRITSQIIVPVSQPLSAKETDTTVKFRWVKLYSQSEMEEVEVEPEVSNTAKGSGKGNGKSHGKGD